MKKLLLVFVGLLIACNSYAYMPVVNEVDADDLVVQIISITPIKSIKVEDSGNDDKKRSDYAYFFGGKRTNMEVYGIKAFENIEMKHSSHSNFFFIKLKNIANNKLLGKFGYKNDYKINGIYVARSKRNENLAVIPNPEMLKEHQQHHGYEIPKNAVFQ
ncbi:MAG: hypothetical protein Q4E16_04430 [Neisseria sp.]|nr:hypothetical protein [Neisseria sp.]